jgi:zinc/manganese transport system permease protein
MIHWLVEPWTYPFMRWALVSCLVLAGIHAYLGFHVVRRGVLFVDLAMAQMAALGAAVGVVLGLEHDTIGGYAISAAFALAASALFAVLKSSRVPQEAFIAVVYALASAATFVVLEHSPHGMDEVHHLFVGQVLTVAPSKVLLTALVYAIIGFLLARLHPRILAVSEGRSTGGTVRLDFLFYATFAFVVTSSVGLVGVLLVFALLVLPAVGAILTGSNDGARLAWGWAFAGAASLVGLQAAFHLDLPAAPVIVITLGVVVAVAALVRRRRRSGGGAA